MDGLVRLFIVCDSYNLAATVRALGEDCPDQLDWRLLLCVAHVYYLPRT